MSSSSKGGGVAQHLDQHLSKSKDKEEIKHKTSTSTSLPTGLDDQQNPSSTCKRRATRSNQTTLQASSGTAQSAQRPIPELDQSKPSIPTGKKRRSARFSLPDISGNTDQYQHPLEGSSGKRSNLEEIPSAASSSKKRKSLPLTTGYSVSEPIPEDRKGKKRAARSPSPTTNQPQAELDISPPAKKTRKFAPPATTQSGRYSLRHKPSASLNTSGFSKEKGKAKAKSGSGAQKATMPKKANPRQRRAGASRSSTGDTRKGSATKLHMDDSMDEDESHWIDDPESSGGMMGSGDDEEDEDMHQDDSVSEGDDDEDEDDDEDGNEGLGGHSSAMAAIMGGLGGSGGGGGITDALDRLASLAGSGGLSGLPIDESTAAALFGGDFRSFGGLMSNLNNRFKRLRNQLRNPSIHKRLEALKECSEILLVSNEETLGSAFSSNTFATEFIAILNGKPNIDKDATDEDAKKDDDEMDEDAQLAAALALSTGEGLPAGMDSEAEMECQVYACRCLAHLMEALPGSGHTLVHLGAVPVLCSKLMEISYIELAEQTLSTMEKISSEYPAAIVREGGLSALLNYLPFFSTNVQRTAVTAAANCCRNISTEHYSKIKDVFPILRETLTQADQRLVEQATLAVVRTIESYRHHADNLEGLLDVDTVVAINALLMPAGASPLLSPSTYSHLLRALTTSARGSPVVTVAFLEAGMTNTLYQILTGVMPSSHEGDEQGQGIDGQGLAGGIADMAVLQNLAHRPKDQVEETLALICELLPPTPRDGVFDSRYYSEKALNKIKKGHTLKSRSDKPTRRSSRISDTGGTPGSAGPSTPGAPGTPTPTGGIPGSSNIAGQGSTSASHSMMDQISKARKDAEVQQKKRVELLNDQPELVGRFVRLVVPVLVDVYAASVATRVRSKVLTGLIKAVASANEEDLTTTLKFVPMASFLCAIISAKDNPSFVLSALQLVELLATKLPTVYQVSFQREGVAFEIEALADQELNSVKLAKEKEAAEREATVVKIEPEEGGSSSGPGLSTSLPSVAAPIALPAPTRNVDALESILSSSVPSAGFTSLLIESHPSRTTTPQRTNAMVDPEDANILRARVIMAKKIFEADGEHKNAATAVLDELRAIVGRLCHVAASDGELRDSLRDLARKFSSTGDTLSSFEILKSGVVDGLLQFVDIDGTVTSSDRRAMLYDVFADTSISSPTPLAMLVKRLHESLGRLENFEVETAFNGTVDSSRSSSSSLSRAMRIRLQAEDGQDVPKQVSSLAITIQAIAPLQALHDYLRPRVADANYVSGSSLSSLFAAYGSGLPIPRGGPTLGAGPTSSSSATGRLLSALNASRPSDPANTGDDGGIASSAPESSSRLTFPPPTGADQTSKTTSDPPRRRSARLSGQGLPGVDSSDSEPTNASGQIADSNEAGASNSVPVLSTSAPEATILPSMPMDMDFDEDEYSEEDYDAEVFEEDMEEEMAARPQEKVVNMSVAPDGSRVEAKTPEGTRIATPSHPAASAGTGAGPSGTSTPRTASYAGAVKTAPNDWHLEFTLNGESCSLDDTIYGAVHKHKKVGESHNTFGAPVIIKFKKVSGPPPSAKAPEDAPSPGSEASAFPDGLDASAPTSKILRLLRVVHNLSVEGRELSHRDDGLHENLFVNNKLTAKLTRQLEEIMIIASNCLPEWATELPRHFSFLFPFETRYSFLESTSFGYGRLISKSQSAASSRNSSRRDDLSHLARIVRQKVRISRSQLLESCAKVLELYGTGQGILEVEYFDEIGTGLGPTLEFYSLASKEFANKSLGLWRDEDEHGTTQYVSQPKGLFPAPMKLDESSSTQHGSRLGWFKTLGIFVGRALLDSRIIDVNLNKVLLKMILGKPAKRSIATLKQVDSTLARSLEGLNTYLQTRKEIEALQLPAGARRNKLNSLTIGGAKLQDLSLDFTVPGYDIELKPGGSHIDVDDHNLEEYLELVLDMTLGTGAQRQAAAFAEGFSMIFPISEMRIFSPEELGLLFGNADEDWSRETIEHAIKADHGYNLDSRAVQNLIQVMIDYTKDERRQFLQFITGAPKLPIGGFSGLTPPFTVVRKPHEPPFRADDYLPSVMTCAQYLKLPDYSAKDVLASQLKRAMLDGGGSFHLS